MKKSTNLPSLADRIRGSLEDFTKALESGANVEELYRCRKVEVGAKPKTLKGNGVKKTRLLLKADRKTFATFLGVTIKTIQAWESGVNAPTKTARRFLDEIRENPKYWAQRFRKFSSLHSERHAS